jgi:hypothetical protein
MKTKWCWFLVVVASGCLIGLDATGSSPKVPPELVGTWHYTTMTPLKNGKPFGIVHFAPGQWTVTFNQDSTWTMKTPPPNPRGLSGSCSVHGHDLEMKLADGKPYDTYRFAVERDGKVLVLTTKEVTISASRVAGDLPR